MNQLQVFRFENNDIRTVRKDDQHWFVLVDICNVLGLSDSRRVAERLEEDEWSQAPVTDSLGRIQTTNIVNESGLYSVILRSDKPEAKQFKKWVTSEVLPSIRKHGAYITEEVMMKTLSDPTYIIGLIQSISKAKEELNLKNQIIGQLKPKVDYLDRILKSKSLVTITQIAKDYGMSGVRLNKLLHELRIQYKQSDQWLLYEDYQDKGYTHSETILIEDVPGMEKVVMITKWTQKGRVFLYNLLKSKNILPVIERESEGA